MTMFQLLKIRTSIDIFKNEKCKVTFGLEYTIIIQQYKNVTFITNLYILLQNESSIPTMKSGPHLLPIQDILSEIVAVNLHF